MSSRSPQTWKPPSENDPLLSVIVGRLLKVYSPVRVYLFGSTARGDANEHSDYDLMVVVPDDAPPDLLDETSGYQALRGTGAAVDLLVWRRSDFDRQLHLKASLPNAVVHEGKLLYAA